MQIQRPSRRTILIAASAVAVLVLVFLSAFLFSASQTNKAVVKRATPATPTFAPVGTDNRPSPLVSTSPEEKVLLDRFENREPLSQSDTQAVANILKILPPNEKSGIMYESGAIRIDYVASADIFQVEILTTATEQAKAEGAVWFKSRGLSQKGVCEYPVQFYLNFEIGRQLKETGTLFSPLAPGC